MSAYNWISVEQVCPICSKLSNILCQTHIASDYDGDERGRFHDRTYTINDIMWWWSTAHKKFANWRVDGKVDGKYENTEVDYEACHSECKSCGQEICVVIKFKVNQPIEIVSLHKIDSWPKDYFA